MGQFPHHSCCQNALNFFTQALAKQAIQQGNLFLHKDQWGHCASGSFEHQPYLSIDKCGLNSLYQQSSQCSILSLTSIVQDHNFKDVRDNCSSFTSSNFDHACKDCTSSIKSARDHFLNKFNAKDNETERAICLVAVVISVTTTKLNDPSLIDDFFRCLPGLNTLDKSSEEYIKIKYSLAKALVAIVLAIFVMMMKIFLVKYVTRNARAGRKLLLSKPKMFASCPGLYIFSKAEIKNAINYIDEKKFLGRGSAGKVFKGVLPTGQVVAIKQIYRSNTSDSFSRELENLSRLTNIVLTEDLEAKLSDFGLAKMLGMEESKVFTDVRGTIGYMDPEYMSNAKLNCASDVYSFGIVALQVLSGQKVIELDLDASDQLTRKAKDVSMGKRELKDFDDPQLKGEVNSVDFESILQIAVLCVAKSSKGRPTIEVVVEEMEKVLKNTLSDKKAAEQSALPVLRRSQSVGQSFLSET
ncbi:hypothetical protein H5410_051983 [Solanum commersonii]|uniref:Protein kinase domain-containing protein n=1 Tax=Solanum commersonii TaxID=4109 RepID=A0A9J5X235_SOLCO|nr:hypothetical protein H5410_051983 [Solanum commersonii]